VAGLQPAIGRNGRTHLFEGAPEPFPTWVFRSGRFCLNKGRADRRHGLTDRLHLRSHRRLDVKVDKAVVIHAAQQFIAVRGTNVFVDDASCLGLQGAAR